MSSADDERPVDPAAGDVAPTESEPEGAEVAQPEAAADRPNDGDDTEGTNPPDEGPQQDVDPGTPEGAGTTEPKAEAAPAAEAEATDTAATPEQPAAATDEAPADEVPVAEPVHDDVRSPILEQLQAKLGDAVVETAVIPGQDSWARIRLDAWADAARVVRDDLGFTYFCFLSAIDWLPSPYGKSEDDSAPAVVDPAAKVETGIAGGETRFQLLARVERPGTGVGITLKADVGDDLVAPTWTGTYAGANWHEREAREMFGIDFAGHPYMVNLYLPGAFEGYPLRKDFPLLARMVKPWPGLVDVEPMPGEDPEEAEAEATE